KLRSGPPLFGRLVAAQGCRHRTGVTAAPCEGEEDEEHHQADRTDDHPADRGQGERKGIPDHRLSSTGKAARCMTIRILRSHPARGKDALIRLAASQRRARSPRSPLARASTMVTYL